MFTWRMLLHRLPASISLLFPGTTTSEYLDLKERLKEKSLRTCCPFINFSNNIQAPARYTPHSHTIILQQVDKVRHDLLVAQESLAASWLHQTPEECPTDLQVYKPQETCRITVCA